MTSFKAWEIPEVLNIPGAPFQYHAMTDLAAEYLSVVLEERSTASPAITQRKEAIASRILDKPTKTFADLMEKALVAWSHPIALPRAGPVDIALRAASITVAAVLQVASSGPPWIPGPEDPNAPPSLLSLDTPLTDLESAMAGLVWLSQDLGSDTAKMNPAIETATIYLINRVHDHSRDIRTMFDTLLAHQNQEALIEPD